MAKRSETGALRLQPWDSDSPERVTMLGGPLHRLGRRMGLVHDSNTVLLGLAIAGLLWLTIVVLAAARGVASALFVLTQLASHVRLLVVIPLLFLAESLFNPQMIEYLGSIAESDIIPPAERANLKAAMAKLTKSANSVVPDAVSFLIAVTLSLVGARMPRYGDQAAAFHDPVVLAAYFALAGTIFRFLVIRWLWRIAVWCRFLFQFSRMKLHLFAGHSDGAGGLGGLELVHVQFAPLAGALAALASAICAEELARGMPFGALYPILAIALAVNLLLVFTPLMFFSYALKKCRYSGYYAYMALAARYLSDFEARWLSGEPTDRELVGAADIQSLADLTNSVDVVRQMRLVPAGKKLFVITTASTLAPLVPLLLFKYSLLVLLEKVIGRFLG
jgi:hypothetical protein